ncbi:MAG: glycoside hydrolase family 28 protein [Firmicutes bacterium]|nr:glycoside hydrolase family 28 protein [Bacillota bacterium]
MNLSVLNPVFNIIDFGAEPDGVTLCTQAFASAIEACGNAGGGTIFVPGGEFLTGAIHLESNMTLFVDAGARVKFSQDPADFPVIDSRWEGLNRRTHSPQIYAYGQQNIAVAGQGIIDGQGGIWWELYRNQKLEYPRPRLISFERCNNISISGITLMNSPSWTVNPIRCENVTVHQATIINPPDSPNTDGINPDSCRNVHISNCHIDVGDDCIAIKSGREGCLPEVPCENITITNCTMVHGHGGVVIGSEMSGGVRNVVISNCVFEGTDRGIRIKTRRGRGGIVEDVRADNIIMKGVLCPFALYMYYFCGPGGKDPVVADKNPRPFNKGTPVFRRFYFSNITATEVNAAAGFIYGLPESPVTDLSFDHVVVKMAQDAVPGYPAMMGGLQPMRRAGFFCCNAQRISWNQFQTQGPEGPAFIINQAGQIEFNGCSATEMAPAEPVIRLEQVKGAFIHGCRSNPEQKTFLELKGPETRGVELTGNSGAIRREQIVIAPEVPPESIVIR